MSGSILKNSISYQGGYFDGSSDGSNGIFTQWAHGNEGIGRIFLQLTGEKNTDGTLHVRNSFEPNRGFRHLGAVELAARVSQLAIDGDAFSGFAKSTTAGQQAKEVGVGLNWILNQNVKLMTDYDHTGFRMAQGATPLHDENVLVSRIQLAF